MNNTLKHVEHGEQEQSNERSTKAYESYVQKIICGWCEARARRMRQRDDVSGWCKYCRCCPGNVAPRLWICEHFCSIHCTREKMSSRVRGSVGLYKLRCLAPYSNSCTRIWSPKDDPKCHSCNDCKPLTLFQSHRSASDIFLLDGARNEIRYKRDGEAHVYSHIASVAL